MSLRMWLTGPRTRRDCESTLEEISAEISRPSSAENECDDDTSNERGEKRKHAEADSRPTSSNSGSGKKSRKWNPKRQTEFSWVAYENGKMFCFIVF